MRNRILILTVLFAVLPAVIHSCSDNQEKNLSGKQDHLIMSVLWFQKSAESRALFIQGYNVAARALGEMTTGPSDGRPRAVVADLDETILDNSPFEAWLIVTGNEYSDEYWKAWTDRAEARPLPGALSFTKEAERLGIEVFYLSNRTVRDAYESTLENMRRYGFPYADTAHIILKEDVSSKIERRNRIMETHDIIMLIGDNLADHDGIFENREQGRDFRQVDSLASFFGTRYIVLPNPMYGSWVNAATTGDQKMPLRERLVRSLTSY